MLITHKLDEALAAADRVTVLRRGEVVLTGAVAGQDTATLAAAMIGESATDDRMVEPSGAPAPPIADRRPLVRIESLDVRRDDGLGIALRGASLVVGPGEIVGVAAVEGNGQRELLRAVAGRIHPLRGLREVAEPVAFIPEDRTTEGLIPEMTLTENVVLGSSGSDPWIRGRTIDWREARARTADAARGVRRGRAGAGGAGRDAERREPAAGGRRARAVAAAAGGGGGEPDPRPRHPRHRDDPRPAPPRRVGRRGGALPLQRPRRGAGARHPRRGREPRRPDPSRRRTRRARRSAR